jgi:DnaJ-domain-containing protein 1
MHKKIAAGFRRVSIRLLGSSKSAAARDRARKSALPPEPAAMVPAWCGVLRVPVDADAQQIRAAYRSLIAKCHPDKVDRLGAESRAAANERAKEITAAYREAMRLNGLKV